MFVFTISPRRRPPSLDLPSVGCLVKTARGPLALACILSCTMCLKQVLIQSQHIYKILSISRCLLEFLIEYWSEINVGSQRLSFICSINVNSNRHTLGNSLLTYPVIPEVT